MGYILIDQFDCMCSGIENDDIKHGSGFSFYAVAVYQDLTIMGVPRNFDCAAGGSDGESLVSGCQGQLEKLDGLIR